MPAGLVAGTDGQHLQTAIFEHATDRNDDHHGVGGSLFKDRDGATENDGRQGDERASLEQSSAHRT